jgi:hypothetical protein
VMRWDLRHGCNSTLNKRLSRDLHRCNAGSLENSRYQGYLAFSIAEVKTTKGAKD